ncbi:unnamed protein product [Ectocarpus sp. 4 AP-2014]
MAASTPIFQDHIVRTHVFEAFVVWGEVWCERQEYEILLGGREGERKARWHLGRGAWGEGMIPNARTNERGRERRKMRAAPARHPPTHSGQEQASTAVKVSVTSTGKDSKQHPSLPPQTKTSLLVVATDGGRQYIRRYKSFVYAGSGPGTGMATGGQANRAELCMWTQQYFLQWFVTAQRPVKGKFTVSIQQSLFNASKGVEVHSTRNIPFARLSMATLDRSPSHHVSRHVSCPPSPPGYCLLPIVTGGKKDPGSELLAFCLSA